LGGAEIDVAEIGGGNSFIVDGFLAKMNIRKYTVWDNNERSINQVRARLRGNSAVDTRCRDVLEISEDGACDLVFSIGLIEHFDPAGTRQAIENHFRLCRMGGYVLMSFPTPTFLYKIIRRSAESIGAWKFPDERPLRFGEVLGAAAKYGKLNHQSILWGIGLTQGYVLFEKR